jgi:hypothetical protein
MNTKPGVHFRTYTFLYIYGIVVVLVLIFLTGCASPQAHRFIDDWQDARADGAIDEREIGMLDRDAEDLDAALRAPPLPPTGIPWLDLGIAAVTAGAAGFGSHKYTMKKRDKSRAEALKA